MTTTRLTPRWVTAALLAALACGTEPPPPLVPDGTYADFYDPGHLIYATLNCDRLLTHALFALGSGDFELSINITNDCTRVGAGYGFGEVLILGTYTRVDSTLTLTPDEASTSPFTGTFDRDSVRLMLPARSDSLGAVPVPLHLPRLLE